MNREEMLAQLMAMDFYMVDLNLYLNTHPNDGEALSKFNAVAAEANNLRLQYEELYGPLSTRRPIKGPPFEWIENPWPWNSKYSYLPGGDQ